MRGLLGPLQKLSKGLTRATDALIPRAPNYGLLTPEMQQEADMEARTQFLGSILQQAGPSLQPTSGFQSLGRAIQSSQEAANRAALQRAQMALQSRPEGYTLGPGERRFMGGQVVAEGGPVAPPEPPSAVQEYQFAVQNGETRPFSEWMRDMRRAGATTINTGTIPSGYAANTDAEGNVVSMTPVPGGPVDMELRSALESVDAEIARQQSLLDDLESGKYEDKGFFGDDFGKVRGRFPPLTPEGESFDALAGQNIIDLISSATFGALSEGERKFLASTVPSRTNTVEGNKDIVRRRLDILRQKRSVAASRAGSRQTVTPMDIRNMTDEQLQALIDGSQ